MGRTEARGAENLVTCLAEEQLGSRGVEGTLGYDLAPPACHEVQQLVDKEAGGQRPNPRLWQRHSLAADGAPQRAFVLGSSRCSKTLEAAAAHCVGAREELGAALLAVVCAQTCAACEEVLAEVFVVE